MKKQSYIQKNNQSYKNFMLISVLVGSILVAALIYLMTNDRKDSASQVPSTPQETPNSGPVAPAKWEKVSVVQGEMQVLLFDETTAKKAFLGTEGAGIYQTSDSGANWKLLGPNGQTALDISIDNNKNRIYFADAKDGIKYSDNQGKTWEQANGLSVGEAHAIKVDPRDTQIVWAGFWLRGEKGSTLYKSEDGGKSWQPAAGGPQGFDITFMKFDDKSKDTYIGTYAGGLFRTSDQGKNWEPLNNGLSVDTDVTLLEWTKDKSVYYIGTHDYGIYRSTDKGQSWQQVNSGKENAADVHGLVVHPNDNNTVYAAAMGHSKGLFKSTNRGDSWQPLQTDGVDIEDVHIFTLNQEKTDIFMGSGQHDSGTGTIYKLKI